MWFQSYFVEDGLREIAENISRKPLPLLFPTLEKLKYPNIQLYQKYTQFTENNCDASGITLKTDINQDIYIILLQKLPTFE